MFYFVIYSRNRASNIFIIKKYLIKILIFIKWKEKNCFLIYFLRKLKMKNKRMINKRKIFNIQSAKMYNFLMIQMTLMKIRKSDNFPISYINTKKTIKYRYQEKRHYYQYLIFRIQLMSSTYKYLKNNLISLKPL